uniref:Uncharacterized protein n=1 Tax=Arundo donax TaxID=35708 RepID=A0A0A9F7E0_ARUDO
MPFPAREVSRNRCQYRSPALSRNRYWMP